MSQPMDDRPDARDLAAMRRVMEDAERGVPETGKHFVIWGVVVASGVVLTYASLRGAPLPVAAIWAVSLAAGWGLSLWTGRREDQRAPVQTLLGRVVAGIWIGCGVTATLVSALGLYAGTMRPDVLPGTVGLVLGAAYFASSFAYRRAWMRLLAVGWWLSGTGMLLWPGPGTLLAMAALLVLLQVVPGVLFYRWARGAASAA